MDISETKLFNQEFLDNWYSHFHQLEAYSKQKENRAQSSLNDADEELAQWVRIQKRLKIILPAELKNKLVALNFNFDEQDNTWEQRYQQLACFAKNNGHTCISTEDIKHEALRDWLIRQIQDQKYLSESQFQKLDLLGIDWALATTRNNRWESMLVKLKEFRKAFGHCRVPHGWSKDKPLANWVRLQRRMHAINKLSKDRQNKLNELSFTWNIESVYNSQWERHFHQLQLFYKTHGHCQVPGKFKKLTSWIENQRTYKKNNQLRADRESKLNEINFIWHFNDINEVSWNKNYRQLREYKLKHGHCFVPINNKENPSLGHWVNSQRRLEAKNQLSEVKRKKLDRLGFVWSSDTQQQLKLIYDSQWQTNFEKLKTYHQVHGSFQVLKNFDSNLHYWARWQRILYSQGRLSKEREEMLNSIGFPWSTKEEYWMKMYKALTQFYSQFGHTRVPSRWSSNPHLAIWVYHTKMNKAILSSQKIELLDKIGFDWVLHKKTVVAWELMYDRLVAFKQKYGHTRVPLKWPEDPKLGKWVSRMRYEKDILSLERLALLELVAFDWGHRHEAQATCS